MSRLNEKLELMDQIKKNAVRDAVLESLEEVELAREIRNESRLLMIAGVVVLLICTLPLVFFIACKRGLVKFVEYPQ